MSFGRIESVPAITPVALAPSGLSVESSSQHAARTEKQTTPSPPVRVLIVDDCGRTVDTFVRYFRLEGLDPTGVTSGAAALAVVQQRAFDAVVLDLYLGDMSGISVLAALRAAGVRSPTIMISGLGTTEEIAAAMKLGAMDFLSKPVNLEDLVRMIRAGTESGSGVDESPSALASVAGSLDPLAELRAALSRLMWEPQRDTASVFAVLARATSHPKLTVGQFQACTEALRRVATDAGNIEGLNLAAVAVRAIDDIQEPDSRVRHSKVRHALDVLGACDESGLNLSEAALGRHIGISASHLGRLLSAETGLGFYEWRRVFRMKRATQHLVDPSDDVRQIGFRLGFSDHSQFDHEFKEFFGLSPTTFRRIVAA